MAMLEVDSLCVEYATAGGRLMAVDGATFSLGAGEALGIAGESACGKSTLGMALMRSLPAGTSVTGSARLDGTDMLAMKGRDYDATHRWKRVSMVFQAAMNSLDPVYTIGEQLAEVLEEHGRARGADDAIASAIRDVGLEGSVLRQYPHELSGGMRQRAVIAMALLLEPRLVIADEPTTALDVLVQSQVIGVLRRLRQRGTSVIVITHDLALLSEIADVVAIMYAGQIVELGSAREIYDRPRHPYTQALIAATPTIHGDAPQHISGRPPDMARPGKACRFMPRCAHAMEKCNVDPHVFGDPARYTRCWLYE